MVEQQDDRVKGVVHGVSRRGRGPLTSPGKSAVSQDPPGPIVTWSAEELEQFFDGLLREVREGGR